MCSMVGVRPQSSPFVRKVDDLLGVVKLLCHSIIMLSQQLAYYHCILLFEKRE